MPAFLANSNDFSDFPSFISSAFFNYHVLNINLVCFPPPALPFLFFPGPSSTSCMVLIISVVLYGLVFMCIGIFQRLYFGNFQYHL